MITKWLNKEGNNSCILFFNGWGMDERAVQHLECNGHDVCLFFGYDHFFELKMNEEYDQVHVIAWSLGVSLANAILMNSKLKPESLTAINGTSFPMHNELGIPEVIFRNTLKNWDQRNSFKFNLRMMGGKASLDQSRECLPNRIEDEQKEELQFFFDHMQRFGSNDLRWEKVLIGSNDQIIPTANQRRYWKGKSRIVEKEWSHFPFMEIKTWDDILEM